MLNKLLGTKIGMTQIFDENRNVVPVTVVNVGQWFVTQVKTQDIDGYSALQIGFPRKRYRKMSFSANWLQDKAKYFLHVKEIALEGADEKKYTLGQSLTVEDFAITSNDKVGVAGLSRGLGFQGVVKRWGFAGGPSGHGSMFHRRPGAIGSMRTQGNVIKGKKLPGQCGNKRVSVENLKVVRIDAQGSCLFIKGAVPGKKDALLFISKSNRV